MRLYLRDFLRDERGATTVDWVVLTGAIIALNVMAILSFLEGGMQVAGHAILSSVLETTENP